MADNKDSVTDDFLKDLGDSEFFSGKSQETSSVEPKGETPKTSEVVPVVTPEIKTVDSTPILEGSDFPTEYIRVVKRIKAQYTLLPNLNYDAIYKEMANLSVRSSPTPTLEILNDELHKVQTAKDRLSEIVIDVIKCYNFKKRAVDILEDAWLKFSTEGNAGKQKGDAAFRLSSFKTDLACTEALSKSCDHIFRNLDSLQDNLSRRITIWQLLLKLKEGRMALPDYDFDRELKGSKMDDLFGENKDDKDDGKNGSTGPQLREF